MDTKILKILDANLNRTREGLRVCEDIARFSTIDKVVASSLKKARHSVTNAMLSSKRPLLKTLVLARNTKNDALKHLDFKKHKNPDIADIFMSNIERVKESLRVLEECSKMLDEGMSRKYRKIRFNVYDIEKKAIKKTSPVSLDK